MRADIRSPIATIEHTKLKLLTPGSSQRNIDGRNDYDTSRDVGNLLRFNGVASRVVNPQRALEGEARSENRRFSTDVSSNALSKKREKKEAALLKLRGLFSSISVSRSEDSDNEVDAITRRQLFTPSEDTIDEQAVKVITSPDSIELSADIYGEDDETSKQEIIHSRDSPNNVTMFEPSDVSSLGNVIVHDNFVIYSVR